MRICMNSQQSLLLAGSTTDALLTSFGMRLHVLTLMRSVRMLLFIVAGGSEEVVVAAVAPVVAEAGNGEQAVSSS